MKEKKKKTILPTQKHKYWFILPMMAIPLLNFLVFWVGTNFQAFLNAFRIEEYGKLKFSFINWKYLFLELTGQDKYSNLTSLFGNTLKYFAVNMFIVLPLALFLAYFLYKKIRLYKFYRVIFFLPNIISGAVLAMLFKYMLNPSVGGFLAKLQQWITHSEEAVNPLLMDGSAMFWVMVYIVWTGFSINLVIFNGALERVPLEIVEAAKIDGVNMAQEFFHVLLPLMWPTISTIIITNVAGIFMSSGPILVLTGGDHNTASLSFWIYMKTKNQESIYFPSTVSLFCTLVAFPLVMLVKHLTEKIWPDVSY